MKSLAAILLFGVSSAFTAGDEPVPWSKIANYCYQLQNINIDQISRSRFQLVVMDYSADGSDARAFSSQQIRSLRHGPGGAKRVLAYLSIGEAEDYRFYWQPAWKDRPHRPDWLGPENPQWRGNYEVKYWDKDWQSIVKRYLDKILVAGYDGIYMDLVDNFEYWGPDGDSGLNRPTAMREMADFVKELARYARVEKGRPDFALFAQNGSELGVYSDYLRAISGIGAEDTWYNGNQRNKPSDIAQTLANLDLFKQAGKPVLVIDYVTKSALIDDFYAKAAAKGYVPYSSDRNLDRLTINARHEPR